eukprot:scaffold57420_cov64-Phaeocystis_antarctica.AAC.2
MQSRLKTKVQGPEVLSIRCRLNLWWFQSRLSPPLPRLMCLHGADMLSRIWGRPHYFITAHDTKALHAMERLMPCNLSPSQSPTLELRPPVATSTFPHGTHTLSHGGRTNKISMPPRLDLASCVARAMDFLLHQTILLFSTMLPTPREPCANGEQC